MLADRDGHTAGAAPPHPIVVGLAGARAADRSRLAVTALFVFDMDGTLLTGTTASVRLAAALDASEALQALEARFAAGALDTRGFAGEVHELFATLVPAQVAEAFDAAPWLTGMADVFADIRARGERSLVITMSPDFFARHLLALGADQVHGSRFPAPPYAGGLRARAVAAPLNGPAARQPPIGMRLTSQPIGAWSTRNPRAAATKPGIESRSLASSMARWAPTLSARSSVGLSHVTSW
jgi:hypothetical protein